jgi:hypothetical protein
MRAKDFFLRGTMMVAAMVFLFLLYLMSEHVVTMSTVEKFKAGGVNRATTMRILDFYSASRWLRDRDSSGLVRRFQAIWYVKPSQGAALRK